MRRHSSPSFPAKFALLSALLVSTLVITNLAGCGTQPEVVEREAQPLTLVVSEVQKSLADAIAADWNTRSDIPLNVTVVSDDKLGTLSPEDFQVIIYPAQRMGELASRQVIAPLDDSSLTESDFEQRDIYTLLRATEMRYGNELMGVTLGGPTLMFWYREDVFNNLGLEPPATWSEYDELLNSLDAAGKTGKLPETMQQTPVLIPLAPNDAANTFLSFAAAEAKHRSQYSTLFDYQTFEPLIASPPFVNALQRIDRTVALSQEIDSPTGNISANEVPTSVARGEAVCGFGWLTSESKQADADWDKVRFAPLPGSQTVYNQATKKWEQRGEMDESRVTLLRGSNLVISISNDVRRRRDATSVVRWLTGPEDSASVLGKTTHPYPFRQRHKDLATKVTPNSWSPELKEEYAKLVEEHWQQAQALSFPAVPGASQYWQALANAVREETGTAGDPAGANATASLESCAETWSQITTEIGTQNQIDANRKSLGLR